MNCEEVKLWMQLELDRELPEPDRTRLQAHLKQCPECAAMFERLRLVASELEQLPQVLPPFSIVDSIMPKLADLTPETVWTSAARAGSSAGTDAMKQAEYPSALASSGKPVSWFSWKLSAGVAAAALLASVFLFHYGTPKLNSAEELAKNADAVKTGSSGSANAASPRSAQQGTVGAPSEQQADSSNHAAQDSARNQLNVSQAVVPGASPIQTPKADSKGAESVSREAEKQSVSPPNDESRKYTYDANEKATPEATPEATSEPVKAKAVQPSPTPAPAESMQAAPIAATSNTGTQPAPGSAAATPPAAAGAAPAETAAPLQGIAAASPAATPGPSVSPAPIRSFAALSKPAQSVVLQNGHVTVLDANGTVVFQSANTWLPSDTITFDWRSDSVLAYTVVREDQPTIVYVIDLARRTEQTELKGTDQAHLGS